MFPLVENTPKPGTKYDTLGAYWIPRCDRDGTYAPRQIFGWAWCVTIDGEKIPGADSTSDETCRRFRKPINSQQ